MRIRMTLLAFFLVVQVAEGRATFQGIGFLEGYDTRSHAHAISADGSTVVGSCGDPIGISDSYKGEAFRWTKGAGMQGLGFLPGGRPLSAARCVSEDGSFIGGSAHCTDENGKQEQAFRWSLTTGMVGLGYLHSGSHESKTLGISPDGSIVVGWGTQLSVGDQAFIWAEPTGLEPLGNLGGRSYAHAISGEGEVVVGHSESPSGHQAFYARGLASMSGLGYLPDGTASGALAVTTNGSVVVGWAENTEGTQAFRWTQSSGMIGLGDLPGGEVLSRANGVSADGWVIVGSATTDLGTEAFIWTPQNGMRSLKVVLEDECGLDLTGWTLRDATGISADGSKIVGWGINPLGQEEAWLAQIGTPIDVLAPVGGEILRVGVPHTIEWSAQEPLGEVTVEYSLDQGEHWTEIAVVEDSGSLPWLVPEPTSHQCLVRIRSSENYHIHGIMPACFLIVPSQGVVVSLVGDIDGFHAGDVADIPFRSNLLLSCSTGSKYQVFKDLDIVVDNWGLGYTHRFAIPAGTVIQSATMSIGVYSQGNAVDTAALMLDRNVDPASISSKSGPSWLFSDMPGYVRPPAGTTAEYTVELSQVPMRDGWGDTFSPTVVSRDLLAELADGEFNVWGCPDTGIDYSLLIIYTEPGLGVASPSEGDYLVCGNSRAISWHVPGAEYIRLEFSHDNGETWETLDLLENTDAYDWLVPDLESDQCLIRVSDLNNPEISATSGLFTISPYERVHFNDANLKAKVEEALGIENPNTNDMLALTTLDARRSGITDLTGLEYAENLSVLYLYSNRITDLGPISLLPNLIYVSLSDNRIDALPDLSQWAQISKLYLHGNRISDISALAIPEITTLGNLYIYDNELLPLEAYRDHIPAILANNPHLSEYQFRYDPNCRQTLVADVNGDCLVNIKDFAVMAEEWMVCDYIYSELCP